jgi:hypothetical protein
MSARYISEDSIMPVSTCSHLSPEKKSRENAKLQICVRDDGAEKRNVPGVGRLA